MHNETSFNSDGGQGRRLVVVLTALILLVGLLWFAYIGFFSRYMADDYCGAASLHGLGFVNNLVASLRRWSGRFSAYFLGNVLTVPGPGIVRFIPALVVLGLVGGSQFLFAGLLGYVGASAVWWPACVLGTGATLLLLGGAPNLYQSLYWMGGQVTYALPLVGLLALLGVLVRTPESTSTRRSIILSAVGFTIAGFLLGDFNEVLACGMVCGLALLLVAGRFCGEQAGLQRMSTRAGAILAGALMAVAVAVVSPGNALRQAEYPAPPPLLYLLATSFKDAGHFVKAALQDNPLLLASIILVSLALGVEIASTARPAPPPGSLVRTLAWMAIGGGVVLVGLMLPVEYATTSYPTGRVLLTAQFILSFGAVCGGCMIGMWLAGLGLCRPSARLALGRAAACLLIAGALASVAVSMRGSITLQRDAQEFAAAWDQRDARIRAAVADGARSVHVPSLSSMGTLEEIKHDPYDWVNVCVAAYYGLDEIYAK